MILCIYVVVREFLFKLLVEQRKVVQLVLEQRGFPLSLLQMGIVMFEGRRIPHIHLHFGI
ncbi:hypothetical protein D3C72_2410790 [compost metagenome]